MGPSLVRRKSSNRLKTRQKLDHQTGMADNRSFGDKLDHSEDLPTWALERLH
jgi:hypothetical protein